MRADEKVGISHAPKAIVAKSLYCSIPLKDADLLLERVEYYRERIEKPPLSVKAVYALAAGPFLRGISARLGGPMPGLNRNTEWG